MKKYVLLSMTLAAAGLLCAGAQAVDIPVSDWAGVIAAAPNSGDRVVFAAGNYTITQPVELKSGVTYVGAGAGATILDCGGTTRAFTAFGNRSALNGVVNAQNDTGPKGWVIEGLTIQNGISDTLNRQDILGVARDLLTQIGGANAGADAQYDLAEATAENGAFTDNPTWFTALDANSDTFINQTELENYLTNNPPESVGHLVVNNDKDDDGGAMALDNGAEGIIRNCSFLNNVGTEDGGAIAINGQTTALVVENSLFQGNSATGDDAGAIRQEGGNVVNQAGSSLTITGCTFRGNSCVDDGGVISKSSALATLTVRNTLFDANHATDMRAVFLSDSNQAGQEEFINCVFANNTAGDDELMEMRGPSTNIVVNCTFVDNNIFDQCIIRNGLAGYADTTGDGNQDRLETDLMVANCIFANNKVGDGDNVIRGLTTGATATPPSTTLGKVSLVNNVFFNNTRQNNAAAPNVNATHLTSETGSITTDPTLDANWVPLAGSPAINGANPSKAPADDYRGWDRVGVADIGALEFGATAPVGEGEGEGEGEPSGAEIAANVYPPYIDEGTLVILTAPAGTGYQWSKDGGNIGGATNGTLVFDPVTEEDAGTYTVSYDNGAKLQVVSPPFTLTVSAAGSVPVAGLLGLAALAGACVIGGARRLRRR